MDHPDLEKPALLPHGDGPLWKICIIHFEIEIGLRSGSETSAFLDAPLVAEVKAATQGVHYENSAFVLSMTIRLNPG